MTPHLERLLTLARVGLSASVKNMTTHEMAECVSAIAAGEGELIAAEHQAGKPQKPAGTQCAV